MKKFFEYFLAIICLLFVFAAFGCSPEIQVELVAVSGVRVHQEHLFVLTGDTSLLTAMVLPYNADDKTLSWSSANDEVASIDENGSLLALSPGETIITVSAGNGVFSDECTVKVLADTGFISIWDMSLTETNTLMLPLYPHINHTFAFTVDWGDGTSETVTSENASHTYEEEDIYPVVITGTCNGFGFSYASNEANEDSLVDVLRWGDVKFHNFGYIFAGCDNLETFSAKDAPNLSGITSFKGLFLRAESFNTDLSAWNTSGVTDMTGMFSIARAFNGDISSWDTSNVTSMDSMFFQANAFNQDISAWNTGNVENMSYIFRLATAFNQDISSWDTESVTNFDSAFSAAYAFNQDISSWDTSNVITMNAMFENSSSFNQDLSGWDVFKVTNMQRMFWYARSYTNGGNAGGLNNWAVRDTCVTTNMFSNCPLDPVPAWY